MEITHVVDKSHFKLYTVVFHNYKINTFVTSCCGAVKSWIRHVECVNRCRLHRLIVGLDVEWYPNSDNPVATLQLCVANHCLIYQILYSNKIPRLLREFLKNPDYTFVGVGIRSDAKKLLADYDLEVANTVDLRAWAADELGRMELRKFSLKDLAKQVLGKEIEKPKNVTLSNWERTVLTKPQVLYACLDAYIPFEIGRRLGSWY